MEKPVISQFNVLADLLIQKYQRYLPTAFDESLSLLEKVNMVIEYLHQVGKINNDVVVQWNSVMEWVMGDGLNESVVDKLDLMVSDGTLESLINDTILADINGKVDVVTNEFSINFMNLPAPYAKVKTTEITIASDGGMSTVGEVFDCSPVLNSLMQNMPVGTVIEFPTTKGLSVFAFNDTVNVTKDNIIFRSNGIGYYQAKLLFLKTHATFFNVTGSEFRSYNVNYFSADGRYNGVGATQTAFSFKRSNGSSDIDAHLINNVIYKFKKGIQTFGRNVKIFDNLISNGQIGIEINNIVGGTFSDCRGYEIQRNRFHSIGGFVLENQGVECCCVKVNALEAYGIEVSNNLADFSKKFYDGVVNQSTINGNIIHECYDTAIHIRLQSGPTVGVGQGLVNGNVIFGRLYSSLADKDIKGDGILLEGYRVTVSNNTIGFVFGNGITINGKYNQVQNNNIMDVSLYNDNVYDGIRVTDSQMIENTIRGNLVVGNTRGSGAKPRYGIYSPVPDSTYMSDNRVTGATQQYNKTPFENMTTYPFLIKTMPYSGWDVNVDKIGFLKNNNVGTEKQVGAVALKGASLADGAEKAGLALQVMKNGALVDGLVATWDGKTIMGAKTPVDADLLNEQISFYIDQATNSIKVKVKYLDGTVKNGTVVALT